MYWYWYWQYFFQAVLVLVLPILFKSIVNNPESLYNKSTTSLQHIHRISKQCSLGYDLLWTCNVSATRGHSFCHVMNDVIVRHKPHKLNVNNANFLLFILITKEWSFISCCEFVCVDGFLYNKSITNLTNGGWVLQVPFDLVRLRFNLCSTKKMWPAESKKVSTLIYARCTVTPSFQQP